MNYDQFVKALSKPGEDIFHQMTPAKCEITHMALGVSSEGGELADAIKKYTMYGQPLNIENVIEEMGDLEFFLERLRQLLKLDRDHIIKTNMEKLRKRYEKLTYTDADAAARKDKT